MRCPPAVVGGFDVQRDEAWKDMNNVRRAIALLRGKVQGLPARGMFAGEKAFAFRGADGASSCTTGMERVHEMKLQTAKAKLRGAAEVFGLGLGYVAVPFLPRRAVVLLARLMGDAGFVFSRRERAIGMANLAAVFGESVPRGERARILRGCYRAFSLVLLDLFWFSVFTRSRVRRYVRMDDSLLDALKSPPVILVTGHFGNWEALGLACGMAGGDLASVANPLANPLADRVLNRTRRLTGQKIVQRRGAVRALMGVLKTGGNAAFLVDQNTTPRDGGVFVDFFGLPVPVSRMPAALAVRTGARIIPTFCVAGAGGVYRAWALEEVKAEGDDQDGARATAAVMAVMEKEIRERPDSWLWMYRRWKYVPEGADAARYPFYSRGLRLHEIAPAGGALEAEEKR
ncbi:MAG: lysophospholipid acyltransferase family protein [Lentisphaerae bacterium]|nr:lysophospholipid acyltransferase family protein [Lentisphaerota bacterium]